MSRATVRAAITDRFSAAMDQGQIPGLATILRAFPREITQDDFEAMRPLGSKWGAVGVVNIIDDDEKRVALGGEHGGQKRVDYTIDLQFFLRYGRTDDDAQGATDALDEFVDDVKAWIRSDRTANSSDVWQWGEALLQARTPSEPFLDETGAWQVWGAVRTQVTEFIQS